MTRAMVTYVSLGGNIFGSNISWWVYDWAPVRLIGSEGVKSTELTYKGSFSLSLIGRMKTHLAQVVFHSLCSLK